jgi:hypothetical protein
MTMLMAVPVRAHRNHIAWVLLPCLDALLASLLQNECKLARSAIQFINVLRELVNAHVYKLH